MQLDEIIKSAIDDFLQSKRINKHGQIYDLFNSENKERDLLYLKDALYKVYKGITLFVGEKNKREIAKQFLLTLERIQGIRIDETDSSISPLKEVADDMKREYYGRLEPTSGLIKAIKHDGLVLLVPALKTEIENNLLGGSCINGIQAIIHEFIHAMSIYTECDPFLINDDYEKTLKGAFEYSFGIIRKNVKYGIFSDLNEGITEWLAKKLCKEIYKNTPYADKVDKDRYVGRVEVVDKILNVFDEDSLNMFILKYLTGRGDEALEMLRSINNGEYDLVEFLIQKNKLSMLRVFDCKTDRECKENDLYSIWTIGKFIDECTCGKQDEKEM